MYFSWIGGYGEGWDSYGGSGIMTATLVTSCNHTWSYHMLFDKATFLPQLWHLPHP